MEVLGFVGAIVSLAGVTVAGVKFVTKFFSDFKNASYRIIILLAELGTLAETLKFVEGFMKSLQTSGNHGQRTPISSFLETLQTQIKVCQLDVKKWELEIKSLKKDKANSRLRDVLQRLKSAVNMPSTEEIRQRVANHQSKIFISLMMSTWYLMIFILPLSVATAHN
jgi:hypothetical protein